MVNPNAPYSAPIEALEDIAIWLDEHDEAREKLNNAVFSVANRMKVHPHDIAIYILIRTASL